jgi:hypothetical protein
MHGALVTSAVFFVLLLGLLRRLADPPPNVGWLIATLLTVAGAAALGISVLLRARIPSRPASHSEEAFWALPGHRTAALAVWMLEETAGIVAGLVFFGSGRLELAAPLWIAALALLIAFAPRRITRA